MKHMTNNRTFTMLKPDSIEKGNIGPILEKITASGFRSVAMQLTQLPIPDAQAFYAVHKDRPFFEDLVDRSNKWDKTMEKIFLSHNII